MIARSPDKVFDAPRAVTSGDWFFQSGLAEAAPCVGEPHSQVSGEKPESDGLAVASSICGLAGFIPIFSQLIGLGLGIWSLVRMRRARLAGRFIRGRGWAAAGITGSALVLLGWVALFAIFTRQGRTLMSANQDGRMLHGKATANHVLPGF